MKEVFAALTKSLRDLTRGDVLWQAVWPPLVALVLWISVGITMWPRGVAMMAGIVPQLPWSGWEWVAQWAAVFLLLAGLAALTYFTAVLLVAVFALPRLINLVAAHHYPDLARHGENVFWGSLANTLAVGTVYVAGSLLTLPLLLIPGAMLVLPLLWGAWLNQRTFRFDAVADHATSAEKRQLVKHHRASFYAAGLATAAVAHLPLINLLAPAFAALVFVHLGLAALRGQRRQGGVEL